MSILEQVKKTIATQNLAGPENPVLLMVSGGSDSTALAYLGRALQDEGAIGMVAMLHVNHMLRGQDADDDQAFVEQLAEMLQIPLFCAQINVPQLAKDGGNVEAIARAERYVTAAEALESLCRHTTTPLSEGRIFTAHTADDRVENFYMRSIVGTGPGGFRSMLYKNERIARPCLDVSRQDLRDFIRQRASDGLPCTTDATDNLWREDATNAHTDRFRAFVRHEIIPKAKERNPKLLETLGRTMNQIADEDDMLNAMAADIEELCVEWEGDYYSALLLPAFARHHKPMQRRVILSVLQQFLGRDARIESASIEAVLDGFADNAPISGYTNNIQGNLALSANKQGLRIEPMESYRARRKKN